MTRGEDVAGEPPAAEGGLAGLLPCEGSLEKWLDAGAQIGLTKEQTLQAACMHFIPPWLLKRIAEAADGYRDDREVFFYLDYDGQAATPHEVRAKTVKDRAAALEEFKAKGMKGCAVGPFRTARTPRPGGGPPLGPSTVDTVTVTYKDGSKPSVYHVDPEAGGNVIDAIFFSVSAFDKFAVPYYTFVYGADVAAQMRERFARNWGGGLDAVAEDGGSDCTWCHEFSSSPCGPG